jgi:hypothetical protein
MWDWDPFISNPVMSTFLLSSLAFIRARVGTRARSVVHVEVLARVAAPISLLYMLNARRICKDKPANKNSTIHG